LPRICHEEFLSEYPLNPDPRLLTTGPYGTAARDAELKQSTVPAPESSTFVESLRSLAELKSSGFLTPGN
jgi:hypothetical protein